VEYALTDAFYEAFFLRKGTQEIIQSHQLKLLVVDLEREEISQWIK
jgi:hypothetical protein